MNYRIIILLFLLININLRGNAQSYIKGKTLDQTKGNDTLSGVFIQLDGLMGVTSNKDGYFQLEIRDNKVNKGYILKAFGKKGYILSSPRELIKWYPNNEEIRKLYFMEAETARKKYKKNYNELIEAYEKYYEQTGLGLYKAKEERNQSFYFFKSPHNLLASLNSYSLGAHYKDALFHTDNLDEINDEIVNWDDNYLNNIKQIDFLSKELSILILLDKADSLYYEKLIRLGKGDFAEILRDTKKECEHFYSLLKSPHYDHSEYEKNLLDNLKILVLGTNTDRKLVEDLFKLLIRDNNIYYNYLYANFLFRYKPIESYEQIISLFDKFNLNHSSDLLALDILLLMRDIYYTVGENKKCMRINDELLKKAYNSSMYEINESYQIQHLQALSFRGLLNKNIDDCLDVFNSKYSSSGENYKWYTNNLISICDLFIDKYKKKPVELRSKTQKYISLLEDYLNDTSGYRDIDVITKIISTLYNYYFNINEKKMATFYKEQFIKYLEKKIEIYPEIDKYKSTLLINYTNLGLYNDCLKLANKILESDAFIHYKAIAYYNQGVAYSAKRDASNAEDVLEKAQVIWEELYTKFPSTNIYKVYRNYTRRLLIYYMK